ncbi:hypothetical protein [Mariniblastus fucicola]|uniref:Squalene/phytoene synthase n=1 Tax=Mariniblastus fucicola TaxID=980251 RepID=A0A5B9P8W3_9BACT|nr:hypothetical protein [Mariniblastus fucicola]QEG21362.1 hypothetical protein MFFC18_12180 [Mariniblastus fucicola]
MDWTNVREVYRKLQDDFHLLTEPFGIFVPDDRNLDLSQLIGAIDVVDRELDRIEAASDRETFISNVLRYLRGTSSDLVVEGSEELFERMAILREAIQRLEIRTEFCDTIRRIVDHGEAKRLAMTNDEMIHHLVEEWRLTGVLPVLFLRELSTPEFEKFFYLCCATMPAIDMLQDARMDYRSGQITIRPTVWLHLKLLRVCCAPLPKLLFLFPAPLTLMRYALSFVWQGIRGATNSYAT